MKVKYLCPKFPKKKKRKKKKRDLGEIVDYTNYNINMKYMVNHEMHEYVHFVNVSNSNSN